MIRLLPAIPLSLSLILTLVAQDAVVAQEKVPLNLSGGKSRFSAGGQHSAKAAPAKPQVTAELVPVDATSIDVKVSVKLPDHHYIYSDSTPFGIPSKIKLFVEGFEAVGKIRSDRRPEVLKEDFGTMEKFYDHVTWTQQLRSTTGSIPANLTVSGELTGQYCSDRNCFMIDPPIAFSAAMPAGHVATTGVGATTATRTGASEAGLKQVIVPDMALPKGVSQVPIRFTVSLAPETPEIGDYVTLTIQADIDSPFHTYSITQDDSVLGGTPTEIIVDKVAGAAASSRNFKVQPAPERKPGAEPGDVLEVHHGNVVWTQEYVVSDEKVSIGGTILFQICNETSCQPPATAEFLVQLGGNSASAVMPAVVGTDDSDIIDPAADKQKFGGNAAQAAMIPFILSAIAAGFVALLTPCVFPMIPVTVSYFVKQGERNPGSTLKLAVIYCLSIVAAFTGLGLLVSVTLGPAILNQVATSAWLNLFFAIVFTAFALMLLGMFDLQMPSWLMTWTSKKQEVGGLVGVIFMALTFTLVSFTCTFAFVGNVLVAAANGGGFLYPIIGMAAFSAAFSSPFFLLAMFPSFLKRLPKSGGWMNRVKVTLGLLELAIVTKFLSVADIGFSTNGMPQYLDYHLVMGSWIAVAVMTSLYLLNVFRMPHDTPSDSVGPISCLFSLSFLGLAAYIAVGLFSPKAPEGALWQQIVAFAPPQLNIKRDADGTFVAEHNGLDFKLDFDAAVAKASQNNTPMFLDFTGVNCINCRLMEKGVLSTESVHNVLEDLVRVQLYMDEIPGVKALPQEHQRLKERNVDLQRNWLQDTSLPSYVIATPDGKEILSVFSGLDSSGEEFQKFLEVGLQKWQQRTTAHSTPAPSVTPPGTTHTPTTAAMNASLISHGVE
ncbi:MAG: cytochrome c biogenesis protein CcdA [Planctomycetaceae bacterium]